jgi:hypothetical protein
MTASQLSQGMAPLRRHLIFFYPYTNDSEMFSVINHKSLASTLDIIKKFVGMPPAPGV